MIQLPAGVQNFSPLQSIQTRNMGTNLTPIQQIPGALSPI